MRARIGLLLAGWFLAAVVELWAMPPHPSLQGKIDSGIVAVPGHNLTITTEELALLGFDTTRFNPNATFATDPFAGPFKILVLLVDFSDKPAQVTPVFFDSLVYSQTQSSVRRYYLENSYGALDLVTVNYPSSTGWRRAPQTLTYYANNYHGLGSYPQNAQKLVEDAADLADPLVNFADYDNDADGYVDGIAVVHAGQGAEYTGNPYHIWSHKWAIIPRLRDGVYLFNYMMHTEYWNTPGDMTIGPFCHEFGHIIGGLPDLYDYDGGSQGIGRWSLMASGSWNGSLGSSPAHLDAWSKSQLGFVAPNIISSNRMNVSIPNAEQSNAGTFRLWTNGAMGPEYFLIENRQKIGYDAALPSSGLLIWHIDDTVSTGNTRPWYPPNNPLLGHYKVALVQADNLFQLEKNINAGNVGDPFPGSTVNRTFNSFSAPVSYSYRGESTFVKVENVSDSKDTMTADLGVLAGGFCANFKGDMDSDSGLTTADVVLHLNCVFLQSGSCDFCFSDLNCDGVLAQADLVLELLAAILGRPFPC